MNECFGEYCPLSLSFTGHQPHNLIRTMYYHVTYGSSVLPTVFSAPDHISPSGRNALRTRKASAEVNNLLQATSYQSIP